MDLSVLAIIISGIAAGFSIWSFFDERKRNRREATIHAFDFFQETAFCKEHGKLTINNLPEEDAVSIVRIHEEQQENESTKEEWKEITRQMALLEHFAVGVNTKTYDIEVLNKMAGNLLIKMQKSLSPIIQYKQKQTDGEKNYAEFEEMVKNLKKMRK